MKDKIMRIENQNLQVLKSETGNSGNTQQFRQQLSKNKLR